MIYIFKTHSSGYEDSFSQKEYKKKEFLKKYTTQAQDTINIFDTLCLFQGYNILTKGLITILENLKKNFNESLPNVDSIIDTLKQNPYVIDKKENSTNNKTLKIFNDKLLHTKQKLFLNRDEIIDAMTEESFLLTKHIPYYDEQNEILNTLKDNKDNSNKLITLSIETLKTLQTTLDELQDNTIANHDKKEIIDTTIFGINLYYHHFFRQLIDPNIQSANNITLFLKNKSEKIKNSNQNKHHTANNFINLLQHPHDIVIHPHLRHSYLTLLQDNLLEKKSLDIEKKQKGLIRGTAQEEKIEYLYFIEKNKEEIEKLQNKKKENTSKKFKPKPIENNKISLLQKTLAILKKFFKRR